MVKSRAVLLCPVFSFSFSMASSGSAKYSRISPCRIFGACKSPLNAPEEGSAGEKKEERASTKTGISLLSEASSMTTASASSETLKFSCSKASSSESLCFSCSTASCSCSAYSSEASNGVLSPSFTLCSPRFCSLFLSCSSCKAFSKAAILASSACSFSCLCRFFSAFFSAFFAKLFSFLTNAASPSGFFPFFFPFTVKSLLPLFS